MTGKEVYELFSALSMHFNTSYDYFKYGGKTKLDSNRIKALPLFEKVGKKVPDKEIKNFIIANLAYEDSKFWINFLLEDKAKDNYLEFQRRNQSMEYVFDQDLSEMNLPWKEMISGEDPPILGLLYSSRITLETFCLLEFYLKFFDYLDRHCKDDIFWPKARTKSLKYLPFLSFDRKKIKNILLKHLTK